MSDRGGRPRVKFLVMASVLVHSCLGWRACSSRGSDLGARHAAAMSSSGVHSRASSSCWNSCIAEKQRRRLNSLHDYIRTRACNHRSLMLPDESQGKLISGRRHLQHPPPPPSPSPSSDDDSDDNVLDEAIAATISAMRGGGGHTNSIFPNSTLPMNRSMDWHTWWTHDHWSHLNVVLPSAVPCIIANVCLCSYISFLVIEPDEA